MDWTPTPPQRLIATPAMVAAVTRQATEPSPAERDQSGAYRLAARSLKATAVLDPAVVALIPPPAGDRKVALVIAVEAGGRRVRAELNPKTFRKALATIVEHGAEAVAVILQGKLLGDELAEAGLSVQVKKARPDV